jgi:capsular exopolysaccharide synthesis family protein
MSRIDEALRKAAEQTRKTSPEPPAAASGSGLDIEQLAREPFPLEMSRRRSPAPVPPPAPVQETAPPEPPAPLTMPPPVRRALSIAPGNAPHANKLVIGTEILPLPREQYRRLAGTLHHAQLAHGLKVVMIASAVQGEGKTLTAANLALTFSESYQRRVLLIDADLRRPQQHSIFRVSNASGLSDLTSSQQEHVFAREVSPRLALLPAGPPTSDPMAGLTSEQMRRVIEEAREGFDWVIIDTPPVVLLSDANLLSAMADGAVLVLRAGSTPYELVERAVAGLGRERILGVVLNQAEQTRHASYGYYEQSYAARQEAV